MHLNPLPAEVSRSEGSKLVTENPTRESTRSVWKM